LSLELTKNQHKNERKRESLVSEQHQFLSFDPNFKLDLSKSSLF